MGLLRLARAFAARFLPAEDREFILGDLAELHARWSQEAGRPMATLRYLRALVASVVAQRGSSGPHPGSSLPAGGRGQSSGGFRRGHLGGGFEGGFLADARHAARALRRRPGFVLVVALTLGLGVGSAGAVFSMANQLLLRPKPGIVDRGDLAFLQFDSAERDWDAISGPDMEALRASATLLEGFASTGNLGSRHVSAEGARPVAAYAQTVYGDYFEILGVRPAIGRLLTAEETGHDAEPLVAVISERLWEALFDRSPDVVGRQLQMAGERLTVVGVAGGGFRGTWQWQGVDVWTPTSTYAALRSFPPGVPPEPLWTRDRRQYQDFFMRLRPGVTLEAAREQLRQILGRLAEADPEHREFLSGLRVTLSPGLHRRSVRQRLVSILGAFAGAAALVLLIACANAANLLLVRGLQARGQLAVRRALGASTGRIVRQHLLESTLLAAAGTAVGLGVAWTITWMFRGYSLRGLREFEALVLDARVLAFAAAAIVGTTLLFGTLPALLAGRFDLGAAMRGAGRGATRRDAFVRHGMAALQIGLSLTLLIGGSLLVRTVGNLYSVDPGIDLEDVSFLTVDFGTSEIHVDRDPAALRALYRELRDAADDVPGVQAATLHGWYGPYMGQPTGWVEPPDRPAAEPYRAVAHYVTPGWFDLFGVTAVAGRTFRASDVGGSPRLVAVVTEPLATRLFGRTNVVGQVVRVRALHTMRAFDEAEIVGVVGEMRLHDLRSSPDEVMFLPLDSADEGRVTVLARTSGPGGVAADRLRRAVQGVVPSLAVPQPAPLTDRIDEQLSEQRLFMRLLGLLSGLAVLLAAVGLYGVIAFAVAGRKREFGIRLALGADGRRIAGLVTRTAARIVVTGTALGLAGAYALSDVIESRLFGVEPVDLVSYAGAATLLGVVAALACWAPAVAATRVDPASTLRQE